MPDLIIKPAAQSGNKVIIQDQAGGAVLTTADSGATIVNATLTAPTIGDLSNLSGTLPASLQGYIAATGGTITTLGDFKVHTFLASGTFTVTNAGSALGSQNVEVLVVGGGGSGGGDVGGGGGAGGLIEGIITQPVTATAYTITVGDGGATVTNGAQGNAGSPSYFAQGAGSQYECKAAGGGRGGDENDTGGDGGSGGGGGAGNPGFTTGNIPAPGTRAYGHDGGRRGYPSGGGGGAGTIGGSGPVFHAEYRSDSHYSGGRGRQNNIDGNNYYWAAGGGGSDWGNSLTGGAGGKGGGGGGSAYYTNCADSGNAGAGGTGGINNGGAGRGDDNAPAGAGGQNTGSGGGGSGNYWGSCGHGSGAGGKGIVIVKYKFQ